MAAAGGAREGEGISLQQRKLRLGGSLALPFVIYFRPRASAVLATALQFLAGSAASSLNRQTLRDRRDVAGQVGWIGGGGEITLGLRALQPSFQRGFALDAAGN